MTGSKSYARGALQRASRLLSAGLLLAVSVGLVGCAAGRRAPSAAPHGFDLVIAGGRVMDPESGLDAVRHVGITDGRVAAISEEPLRGDVVIDAADRVVAPGFIDLNTYEHSDPLFRSRAADGVTTVLNLEGGAVDVAAYYDALEGRSLVHHGTAVDHGSLRHLAQGDTSQGLEAGVTEARGQPELDLRRLSDAELEDLVARVERELRAGAVAIGMGIEYTPGATHSEVLRVVEVAARHGASAHLHVRDFEPTRDWDQLNEVFGLAIRTGGDLHVNHLNSIFGSYSSEALEAIEAGRARGLSITTECYPYTAALTFIQSALFDDWESWEDARFARYEWPATGERLTRERFGLLREQGGVVAIHPRDEARQERAVRDGLAHPLPMVASDGSWDGGRTHPRVAGTNSRVLGRYVREERVLPLMEALRKMSLAPARHLERRVPAMRDKGRLRVGADADLVVFDPDTVIDRATFAECTLPPSGIDAVLVAGVVVVQDGVVVEGVYPGRAVRAPHR